MKDRDANRHPGPMRVMRVDAEFAGIIVAVGFVVLGLVGLPIAKWFPRSPCAWLVGRIAAPFHSEGIVHRASIADHSRTES
jgi:hypothetical protein